MGRFHGQTGQFPATFVSHVPEGLKETETSDQGADNHPNPVTTTEVARRGQIEHKSSRSQRSDTKVHRRVEEVKGKEEKPKVNEVDKEFKAPGIHLKSREVRGLEEVFFLVFFFLKDKNHIFLLHCFAQFVSCLMLSVHCL